MSAFRKNITRFPWGGNSSINHCFYRKEKPNKSSLQISIEQVLHIR
jgi:hypothetical protein